MHLHGYGCAGASATAYGITCLELEAGDSGLRSFCSVQGSLAMYAIHRWGSEEQKERWLPGSPRATTIGCFGLTEPDAGSNPAGCARARRRDGDEWVLDGSKMWITNGSMADVGGRLGAHRGGQGQRLPGREGHARLQRAASCTASSRCARA